jgi:NADP-dependent 3-hydroxy acid dehydrogenase YdfG
VSARTHLLTGAGSGIGRVLAERLVERGDRVLLLARSEGRAEELAAALPGAAAVLVADLGEPAALAEALAAQELPDRLDSLLHVAGVVELGPVAQLPAAVWRHTLDVNLLAPAELTRLLLPALRAARGHVVLVNSGSGLAAHAQWSSYAASKHGLRALADALRAEEAAHGVRVTSVYPGRTATAMQAKVHAQEGKDYDPGAWIEPGSVATTVLMALDLPRDAEVTDLSVRPGPG